MTNGKNPRILDLKLGYTAYNEKKIYTQSKKYKESTCNSEGFRFAGLKVFIFCRVSYKIQCLIKELFEIEGRITVSR